MIRYAIPNLKHKLRIQRTMELLLNGKTVGEIAESLGVCDRTIRRDLDRYADEHNIEFLKMRRSVVRQRDEKGRFVA